METLAALAQGFAVALTPFNLFWAMIGVEAAFGSQTNWPGPSVAAFSMTDSFWCATGFAAAEAATHARKPNSISRFTNYLVQAICSRTGPRLRAPL